MSSNNTTSTDDSASSAAAIPSSRPQRESAIKCAAKIKADAMSGESKDTNAETMEDVQDEDSQEDEDYVPPVRPPLDMAAGEEPLSDEDDDDDASGDDAIASGADDGEDECGMSLQPPAA